MHAALLVQHRYHYWLVSNVNLSNLTVLWKVQTALIVLATEYRIVYISTIYISRLLRKSGSVCLYNSEWHSEVRLSEPFSQCGNVQYGRA